MMNQKYPAISFSTFVALSAAEWRNFLAQGRVRVVKGRLVQGFVRSDKALQKMLFVRAPHGNLTDSKDYRVVELHQDWHNRIISHPRDLLGETLVIPISAMVQTFPAFESDQNELEEEAQNLKVAIGSAEFSDTWEEWMIEEGVNLSFQAGIQLIEIIGIGCNAGEELGFDGPKIARLLLHRLPDGVEGGLMKKLINERLHIEESATAVFESEAFYIACVYEWVFRVTQIDLLGDGHPLAHRLQELYSETRQQCRDRPDLISEPTKDMFLEIRAQVSSAFENTLSPLFIPLFVRFMDEIARERLNLATLRLQIHEFARLEGLLSARILAFCLGVELQIEKVRLLAANPDLAQLSTE